MSHAWASRAFPGGPARGCPSGEDVEALLSRDPASWPAGAEAHLASCERCRALGAELRRDRSLFEELKGVSPGRAGPLEIPGYRLEAELHRGGQGVVHRATQITTQRVVAIKLLVSGAAPSARERRRFEREVELASRLAHPGIVTVFDSGVAGGLPWYAMEWVDGETLDAWVLRTRPDRARRLALFLELCAAVAHAHRAGVIHRDLKPGNVLVEADGRVRVLDFGTALPLAATRLAATKLTAPGEFLGTLAYASPEQVAGGSEACDTRTDVYSLGVVLHELLTGVLPIDTDGGLSEVVERILHAPPAVAELERDLATIVRRALEKEPERRYASVDALARDVTHFRAHEPIEARPRSAGYVLAKALHRHRRAVVLAGVLLVLGGAALSALVRERLNARRAGENAALVRSVFEEVLSAAAPGRMGGDAPLRDVLALAAQRIDATLAGAPDVHAAVRFTIGDTYRQLLMPEQAEPHLRLALERFRATDGAGLETARCLEALGAVLAAQDRPEAIPVQEEGLAIRSKLLPASDVRIARSERALAVALLAQLRDSDDKRAQRLLVSALERLRGAAQVDDFEVAETELVLARLSRWHDDPEAEGLLKSALATFERDSAARDPRRIDALAEYAGWLQVNERLEEAEGMLARAEELTRELYGDELTSDLLRRRATVALARGTLHNAEELSRRALAFELARWGASRPDDAADVRRVHAELGAAPSGSVPFQPAFRLLLRFRGEGSFELAAWMRELARMLRADGRSGEAEALLRDALTVRCRAFGAECPIRQGTLLELGELLEAEQRAAEARPVLEESLAIAEVHGEAEIAARVRLVLARCDEPGAESHP